MREILFQAKRIDNGEWREGYYFTMSETTYAFAEDYERHPVPTHHYIVSERMTDWSLPNRPYFEKVDPETVCQYTGLKDRNGRKIFEGDIILYETAGKIKVQYEKAEFMVVGIDRTMFRAWLSSIHGNLEIIGNIFDNPELVN